MRRHFLALNTALGKSTSQDLRALGREQVADDLQKAVKACIQQEYADSLVSGKLPFIHGRRICSIQVARSDVQTS